MVLFSSKKKKREELNAELTFSSETQSGPLQFTSCKAGNPLAFNNTLAKTRVQAELRFDRVRWKIWWVPAMRSRGTADVLSRGTCCGSTHHLELKMTTVQHVKLYPQAWQWMRNSSLSYPTIFFPTLTTGQLVFTKQNARWTLTCAVKGYQLYSVESSRHRKKMSR